MNVKFDVGKHLFIQMIIIIFQFVGMYLLDIVQLYQQGYEKSELFFLSTCMMLGIYNAIYIGGFILNRYDNRGIKVLYILFFPLIIIVLFMLVLPLLLAEMYLLYRTIEKTKIDSLFENDEEKRKVNQTIYHNMKKYVSKKRKLRIYQIAILILITCVLLLSSIVITNKIVLRILFVFLIIGSYLVYKLQIETRMINLCNDLFLPILMEECDAEKFCYIFKILERYYGTFDIAFIYMNGLTWTYDKEYELDSMLKKYKSYMKNVLYKQIQYIRGNNTERDDQELYETLLKYYEKLQKKNNNKEIKYQIKMLQVKKYMKEENYQKILNIINDLIDNKYNYSKAREVQLNYYKGMSLDFFNRKDESEFFLRWVINYGNTLCYVEMAKELSRRTIR